MYRKRTLLILAAILVAEAVTIVAIPARVPRAVRAMTAAVNIAAAAALVLLARRKPAG